MNDKVYQIGIIGYGGFGQFLKNSWQPLDNVRIIAVADENAGRNPGGDIVFYERWHDLLKDKRIDIVSIATPPQSHANIACAALESHKHVLIEKPIATSVQDAQRIMEAQDASGCVATVDYMLRFNPLVENLTRLTKEGVFGKLRHADVENYAQDEGLPPEHWFWNPQLSGGILIEHAVHFIDLVNGMTEQRYISVTGFCHRRNASQEDQVLACVKYDGGLIATHYHSFARPGFFENTSIRLNYDLAQIDVQGWIPLTAAVAAMVSSRTKAAITQSEGFKATGCQDISQIKDLSRPEGWGPSGSKNKIEYKVRSGGIEYNAQEVLEGQFVIKKGKQDVYGDCVRAMLSDLICKVENRGHVMRVTLEDGLTSLDIAERATEFGRNPR